VLLERARVAVKLGDTKVFQDSIARLAKNATAWLPVAQEHLRTLQAAVSETNSNRLAQDVIVLKNILVRDPAYRQSRAAIQAPFGQEGEVISRFLRLPWPHAKSAAPDEGLTFAVTRRTGSVIIRAISPRSAFTRHCERVDARGVRDPIVKTNPSVLYTFMGRVDHFNLTRHASHRTIRSR